MLRLALFLLLGVASAAQAADEKRWSVGRLALPAAPSSLEKGAAGPLLSLADGSAWTVRWKDDAPSLQRATLPPPDTAPGLIPGGRVAEGAGAIRRAWLAEPARGYGDGTLDGVAKAKSLRIETAAGETLSTQAPDGTVFEDLAPRLWDLDADGQAEAWVIRTDPAEGARLEAYAVHEGALIKRFATDPMGRAHQWLNPVGVADFTGNGQREVALVRAPDTGGLLLVYRQAGVYLDQITPGVPGLSNHASGSRQLGLSWIGDVDGDGAADILLPGKTLREMAAFGLTEDGSIRILGTSERTGHMETNLVGMTLPGGGRVILFADDGPALRWLRLPE